VLAARVTAGEFTLDLRCRATQPPLLQGDHGLSRKGPRPDQASYYYSEPQLAVEGSVVLGGQRAEVKGRAWLDHEWSDELLDPAAVGWDWIGMNLADGSALTAFRLRRADGSTLWDGGSFRAPGRDAYIFSRGEVVFQPRRHWTSPLSQATYPVEWTVRTPADFYTVSAVLDNQELDSRASTGAIYWEGLARLTDSNGRQVGHGYLEMTGYAKRLRL
jgi:predicted secreted hydrolase